MKRYFKYLFFLVLFFSSASLVVACGGEDGNGEETSAATTITCFPTEYQAPAVGATFQISVDISNGEWTAFVEGADWVKIQAQGTASKSGTVDVTVAPNTGTESRSADIVVKSGMERTIVKVTQDAPLQVAESSLYFSSAGSSVSVAVVAAGNWTVSSSASWLTAQKSDNAMLTVTAAPNETLETRQGTLTITAGAEAATIAVQQNGADDRNIAEPPVAGYHLVWNDEFATDGSLDTKNWRHEVKGSGWVNHELQNYVNEKSPSGQRVTEVIDGKLHINCFKEDGKVYSGRVYGNVTTGWQYGYVEARIKLPSGKGTWPAFWMMPVHFTSWPHDGEIDIMEEVGYHKDYVSSSLHADGHVHSNGTQVTKEVYCKGAEGEFHVYGMEWTKDYFQFYVDGNKTLYYKNPGTGVRDWPYDAPFYVILNLAWGGDWGGSQGVDEKALPVTMEVDYVRVFQ